MALDTDTTTELDEVKPDETSIRSGLEAAFAEEAADSPSPAPAPTPRVPDATAPAVPTEGVTAEAPATAPAPATERPIPERLKSRYGEKWATIPSDIRDTFHEYESNIGRLASTYGKQAKSWDQAQKIFAPYAEMVHKEGGDFHTALSNLLETSRILRQGSPEQKVVLLRQTAQAFGVPLDALVGSAAPAADGQTRTSINVPDEGLINRLNALEREVLTTRGAETHNTQQQVNSEIEAFMADPANIYLQEPGYLDTMATLIKAGKAENLSEAYKQAAWLHERPRQLEIAKQTQQREQASREAAARARRASVSVNGSAPGAVRVDPGKMTLRDTLVAAFDGELDP